MFIQNIILIKFFAEISLISEFADRITLVQATKLTRYGFRIKGDNFDCLRDLKLSDVPMNNVSSRVTLKQAYFNTYKKVKLR